jgi:hypothetical protein
MNKLINEIKYQGNNLYKKTIDVDNFLIDSCFSYADGIRFEETKDQTFDEVKLFEDINYIINNMLPDIEKQVIYLLFFLKKDQETTGRILKISQEMVYYYKKRALLRIKIHYRFRRVDLDKMEAFLKCHVTKKQQIAMIEYFKEHDLRKIAQKISKMENRKTPLFYEGIGSRIKLGIKKLKTLTKSKDPEVRIKAKYYHDEIFCILKKYNSLHHTQSKKSISKEIIIV